MNYSDSEYDWDGYDSDADREFIPGEETNSESNDRSDINDSSSQAPTINLQNEEPEPQVSNTSDVTKTLTRKRVRNVSNWKCNVRKLKHDRGEEYVSIRRKTVPAKKIKTTKDCLSKCIYKCAQKINEHEKAGIFSAFYELSTREKQLYILSTTQSFKPGKRRKGKDDGNSRKAVSYNYFFNINAEKIQVCKLFYCGTLSISQKPIYTAHKNKSASNTPTISRQGKHRKKFTPEEDVNFIKAHIDSFPRVESHYCRQNTKRQYLEPELSIKKMYDLYLEWITEQEKTPVKFCTYRKIFCTEFNLYFHKPRKDRCDLCEEVKLKKQEDDMTEEKVAQYERHISEKKKMREEKQKDKDKKQVMVCFDLENVITCPKAEIKNFFYKSKLNVYNMTAHLSIKNRVYCAVWPEILRGRCGNDIASAVYIILTRILEDNPYIEDITLWSDSCVPQNRNSLMSFAMGLILQKHINLKKITMKFSVPGHSCIQEVDAIHSCIERVLKTTEFFSPLSLIRILLKVNGRSNYKIIQMKREDFKDFQTSALKLNYNAVPFTKVCVLQMTKSQLEIKYKTSYLEEEFTTVNLRQHNVRTGCSLSEMIPKTCTSVVALPQNKVDAVRSMLPWIPKTDRVYYETTLPKQKQPKKKIKQTGSKPKSNDSCEAGSSRQSK